MGLLDDAIREHLDLKRARGGDPAEIERMEREALGPVRREPTIGSERFEAAEDSAYPVTETGYPDDRDQLEVLGYHDSTAPHPHPHHEHHHHDHADPYLEHEHDDPFEAAPEQPEQPKRRFLRRNRSNSAGDSVAPDAGFHEQLPVDPHDLLNDERLPAHHEPLEHYGADEYHEPVGYREAVEHDQPGGYHEADEHHEPLEQHESPSHEADGDEPTSVMPPHLQFDQPPKRPRFSAEPPSGGADTDAGGDERAVAEDEAQETTEFDVQKHIAETRFQPDPEALTHPGPAAPAGHSEPAPADAPAEANSPVDEDEDVLEETPEFLQDTPEHDRLWFEQRPPRDFDFDG